MDNLRVLVTLVIVIVLALLSVFQMQLRGYEKVCRMEEWVLYLDEPDNCEQTLPRLPSLLEYYNKAYNSGPSLRYYQTWAAASVSIPQKSFIILSQVAHLI